MATTDEKITLREVTRKVDALPTLPEIATFVLNLLEDPNTSSQDVTNVIVRDSSLSGQILKLVNSAYFGLPQKVNDLNRGIALLGFGRIKNLVLSLSILKIFRALSKRQREDFNRFWQHSAVVAGLMKRLSLRMGRSEPEQAFVAGLLHDVGKVVLLGYFPKEYATILKLAEERKASFAATEGDVLATTHAEIGAWLAKSWNLARDVMEAIANHHKPQSFEADALSATLYFADYAAKARGVSCAGSCDPPQFDEKAWEVLGLPQEDYFEMMAAVDNERAIADIILQVSGASEAGAGAEAGKVSH